MVHRQRVNFVFQCTHCLSVITRFGNYLQHAAFSHPETLERTDVDTAEADPAADVDNNPFDYPSLATLQRQEVDGAAAAATFWEQAVSGRCSPVPHQKISIWTPRPGTPPTGFLAATPCASPPEDVLFPPVLSSDAKIQIIQRFQSAWYDFQRISIRAKVSWVAAEPS